jgi:hypothetical protein
VAAAALIAALAATAPATEALAQGPSLDAARELFLEADFRRARTAFRSVLERRELDAAEALEAHRYLAVLGQMLRDEGDARRHAEAAVALAPDTGPPEGSPAEATSLFEGTRRALGGRRATLRITPAGEMTAEQAGRVEAVLDPAPPALAARVRLRCTAGSAPAVTGESESPRASVEVTPPAGADVVACDATALGAGGGAMVTASERFAVGGGTVSVDILDGEGGSGDGDAGSGDPVDDGDDDDTPGPPLWVWLAAGGAAATAVAIITIALVAGGADDAGLESSRVEGWP